MKKPKAADRTINFFTGLTNVEAQEQTDVQETVRGSETIEQAAERWRANAHYLQMFVSKSWGVATNQGTYRLTLNDNWWSLEQFRNGPDGKAFGWKCFMFPKDDLHELTNAFVRACKGESNGQ